MPKGSLLNRLVSRSLLSAIALASLLPAAAGAAVLPQKNKGPLSPLLGELAKRSVATKAPAVQDHALGIAASGPAGLVREGSRVLVTARFGSGAVVALPQLREAGARVVSVGRDQQTATLSVLPTDLRSVAAVAGVRSVWQVRRPVAYGVGEGPCEGGSVISEGFGQLHVDHAREAFELRGKGETIGVLSDSFDKANTAVSGGPIATHAKQDIVSNDLPGLAGTCSEQQLPVKVLAEGDSEGEDEGRAMLQIVHDLAPHAKLAFATAFESEESFAQNIERLARPTSEGGAGADVIVDDVAWFEEPFFQDGPVAKAIDKVTEEGVSYLTATGNDNLFDELEREIGSWEAPAFRDSGSCPTQLVEFEEAEELELHASHCMDFKPGGGTDTTFGITVEPGETLIADLQWAEPWQGVTTDLDAYLFDESGELVGASVEENSGLTGTQRPVEIVGWENESNSPQTVQLVINRFSGVADPRLKFILAENGRGVSETEYPESSGGDVVGPTIFGHAGAAAAISVAAVPFDDSVEIEEYSSRGPVTHYFGPVQGVTPALPLGSPEELAKPDIAATDCGATTFFASFFGGKWRFCGTSAAAPHAAAGAALVRQAKPGLSELQVREALAETAAPVGIFGPTAAGAGLVDAFEAIGSLPAPIVGGDGPSAIVPSLEEPSPPQPPPTQNPTPPVPPRPVAPNTKVLRHPGKIVRTPGRSARVVFRFGSDQAGATFLCKVDKGAFRPCGSRIARRFKVGAHLVKVKALSSAGLADPTPATFGFRVKHVG
jgi:subtilisin family serine protease